MTSRPPLTGTRPSGPASDRSFGRRSGTWNISWRELPRRFPQSLLTSGAYFSIGFRTACISHSNEMALWCGVASTRPAILGRGDLGGVRSNRRYVALCCQAVRCSDSFAIGRDSVLYKGTTQALEPDCAPLYTSPASEQVVAILEWLRQRGRGYRRETKRSANRGTRVRRGLPQSTTDLWYGERLP